MHPVFRKLFSTVLGVALFSFPATAQSIIPQPLKMKMGGDRFMLPERVLYHFKEGCEKEAAYFQQKLENIFSIKTAAVQGRKKRQVSFDIDHNHISLFGTEGYQLIINNSGIHVSAAAPAGIFYAIQSILQLMEKDERNYSLPYTEIFDKPRFSWRAFLMDDARSFKGAATVKKMLDEMAFLKMNVFHWHLTDDQGWRIQIPRYPKLTSVSSGMITAIPGKTFYTQGEIRDIVEYAAERHILIVPEIEMPGHASAAIAAYPELGVEKKPVTMPSGQGIFENIYDVSDTSVIQFIHDVINEVKTL
ncbi:MAG TPA: family 20 glycosylhydrolase, partial [Agriterribacter sp.]|nr:family 20 glycosylhydrolase [Agriterribacter sp.]